MVFYYLFPFFDKSDKKRVSRTCNHIALETENSMEWKNFPEKAIAIGHHWSGNRLVLTHDGGGILSEEILFWDHETGELEKIGNFIDDFES